MQVPITHTREVAAGSVWYPALAPDILIGHPVGPLPVPIQGLRRRWSGIYPVREREGPQPPSPSPSPKVKNDGKLDFGSER